MVKKHPSPAPNIDRNSSTPLYSQLKEALLSLIQSGSFQKGDFIPTERHLGEQFQVSRITVRRAIDELAREGYLTTQQGRGTVVARTKIQRPMTRLASFSTATTEEGHQPGSRLLSLRHEKANRQVASALEISIEAWVWVVERLRLIDAEAIGLSLVYLNLPPDVALTPLELNAEVSLWSLLEQKGIALAESNETIQAVGADASQAQLLNVAEGYPLLLVEGVVLTDKGKPVEYHQVFNRGDRYKYSFRNMR